MTTKTVLLAWHLSRLGMTITRNPGSKPPWLQVVGVLENPASHQPRPNSTQSKDTNSG